MTTRRIKFINQNTDQISFYQVLNNRVNNHFISKNLSPHANNFVIFKIIICLLLFFGLYSLIISNQFSGFSTLILVLLFGIASTFLGFNIGHDAVHGALFNSSRLNKLFGYAFELIGMSSYAWYLKHNLVHHNNPNVRNADFDIEAGPILRLSPADKLLPHHYYQHLYAPFTYMLFSLSLVFYDDIIVVFKTTRESIDAKVHPAKQKHILIISKLLYVFFMLILPLILMDYHWWQILLGFLLMHFSLSIILAFVLIPAHIFEHTQYPIRNETGKVNSNWAVHQMQTTIDYAVDSKLCNLLFGGLNINVVHHLFPRICHIHLIPISKIVKQTAQEFGIPYHQTSMWGAMVSHLKTLKILGRNKDFDNCFDKTI